MDPYIGQLMLVGFNFAPRGWATCDGQLLAIQQNSALFSLLGTTYGGDGKTTFALPDLRGRVPMHRGNGPNLPAALIGAKTGAPKTKLSVANLPAHGHALSAVSGLGNKVEAKDHMLAQVRQVNLYSDKAGDVALNAGAIGQTGSNEAFDAHQPSLTLNWIIALVGIYPARQ